MHNASNWFRDAAFGLFLHWGVYSVPGRGEWLMHNEQMPVAEYDRATPGFTAEAFDPRAWAELARRNGMRYMVLTAKHHDGFCLFDTATTRRNSVDRGPRRDLVHEYAAACREAGLKVGLYFSPPDWSIDACNAGPDADPAAWRDYVDLTHTQLRELLGNYGKIDLLWFDRAPNMASQSVLTPENWRTAELEAMIRRLQPDITVNDRGQIPADFHTVESSVSLPEEPGMPWEGSHTMNGHWGYCPADREYKSITSLLIMLTFFNANGGNFLLNAGPDAAGRIGAPELERLEAMGRWMAQYGDTIRNLRADPEIAGGNYGMAGRRGDDVFLFVHFWYGNGELVIPNCPLTFSEAELLGSGGAVAIHRHGRNIKLTGLPATPPDPYCSVIRLRITDKFCFSPTVHG